MKTRLLVAVGVSLVVLGFISWWLARGVMRQEQAFAVARGVTVWAVVSAGFVLIGILILLASLITWAVRGPETDKPGEARS